MFYDVEANIISWEVSKGEITHAKEFGNFIIHFSALKKPILVEILDASNLVGQFDKIKDLKNLKNITGKAAIGVNYNKIN
jgi:hypothetical protein